MSAINPGGLHFHRDLDALEQRVLGVADQCETLSSLAVDSVTEGDLSKADEVIAAYGHIHDNYYEIHHTWTDLIARNQPLGSDLRRMAVILQLNATFERMGAQCSNIAKVARQAAGLPRVETMAQKIREMGDLVRPMIRAAMGSYVKRDVDEARLLPAMDQPLDRLNSSMYQDVVSSADNPEMLEWATKMIMVSRALERIGDQAVDFAEQAVYLVTGERAQFDEGGLAEALSIEDN